MTEPAPQVSIVVPAFNEERRLERTLARIREWMDAAGMSYEVLVVDDGSKDGTRALAEKFAREHPHFSTLALAENRGPLIAQNMLEKGHERAAAENEIDRALAAFKLIQGSSLALKVAETKLELSLEIELAGAK